MCFNLLERTRGPYKSYSRAKRHYKKIKYEQGGKAERGRIDYKKDRIRRYTNKSKKKREEAQECLDRHKQRKKERVFGQPKKDV